MDLLEPVIIHEEYRVLGAKLSEILSYIELFCPISPEDYTSRESSTEFNGKSLIDHISIHSDN